MPKRLKQLFEVILLILTMLLFKIIGFYASSSLAYFILRIFYPLTKFKDRVNANIKIAFPSVSEDQINLIVEGMIENLGRSIGEFPHLYKFKQNSYKNLVKINGQENLQILNKGGIVFTAHMGNWELMPHLFSELLNEEIYIVYRKASNPYVEKIINLFRKGSNVHYIAKGHNGAKQIIRALKKQKIVTLLVDQRLKEGIEVPFFSKDSLTPPALASLAIEYNVPIVPLYIIRVKNREHKFEIFIEKPLKIKFTDNKKKDVYNIMLIVNRILEKWIRSNPSQWFWIHNRWAKNKTHR